MHNAECVPVLTGRFKNKGWRVPEELSSLTVSACDESFAAERRLYCNAERLELIDHALTFGVPTDSLKDWRVLRQLLSALPKRERPEVVARCREVRAAFGLAVRVLEPTWDIEEMPSGVDAPAEVAEQDEE